MTGRPVMTRDEVSTFLDREFPQIHLDGRIYRLDAVGDLSGRMRMEISDRHVRPGGTVSGPSMMTLADLAFYVTILANIGPVGLAVTTNLSFNFLRKPALRRLVAECRLLKLGKRLAVGEVTILSEGSAEPVCHATGTYSVPPERPHTVS